VGLLGSAAAISKRNGCCLISLWFFFFELIWGMTLPIPELKELGKERY